MLDTQKRADALGEGVDGGGTIKNQATPCAHGTLGLGEQGVDIDGWFFVRVELPQSLEGQSQTGGGDDHFQAHFRDMFEVVALANAGIGSFAGEEGACAGRGEGTDLIPTDDACACSGEPLTNAIRIGLGNEGDDLEFLGGGEFGVRSEGAAVSGDRGGLGGLGHRSKPFAKPVIDATGAGIEGGVGGVDDDACACGAKDNAFGSAGSGETLQRFPDGRVIGDNRAGAEVYGFIEDIFGKIDGQKNGA